jgi:N-acetylglucosaminyldiphosphoundecaprenol N-acetyl-beta-D-mannosaminyltransferase
MGAAAGPEHHSVLCAMKQARPDVIWVGLGLPKQEYWMERYASYFPRSILVGVGAAFDWYAGQKARAPRWVQTLGLEWLHRVACERRGLWPRYRVVVPRALAVMARELLWPAKRRAARRLARNAAPG